MVAGSQNVSYRFILKDVREGTQWMSDSLWQDITLTGSEPRLQVPYVIYNTGDADTQEIALRMLLSQLTCMAMEHADPFS